MRVIANIKHVEDLFKPIGAPNKHFRFPATLYYLHSVVNDTVNSPQKCNQSTSNTVLELLT